jgi:hypothetical protein
MPNDELIDYVLARSASVTPSERFELKLAASLLKQLDPDYDITTDTDTRIKLSAEERDWRPGAFELWNAIAKPKDWAMPEHIEAAQREDAEIREIMKESGIDYLAALTEYEKRRKMKKSQIVKT